jgi:membrane-associated phospholipid phosphatase
MTSSHGLEPVEEWLADRATGVRFRQLLQAVVRGRGSARSPRGPRGRPAAVIGVAAIEVTPFVVNQPMKLARERHRPDRRQLGVPESRWVRMPSTTSFPSGHAASAAAFSGGRTGQLEILRVAPGLSP